MYFLEMFFIYVFITAVVLTVVIFVHEMGHYLCARLFGVRVDVFSIGFGREIWGKVDRYGTRWKISIFPFGGFVSLKGDCPPSVHTEQYFSSCYAEGEFWTRPNWQRSLVAVSGPVANFIFSFLVLFVMYAAMGHKIASPVVNAIEIGSGADLAGVQLGDEIISINHIPFPENFDSLKKIIDKTAGDQLSIAVMRDGEILHLYANLKSMIYEDHFGEEQSRRVMGVVLGKGLWALKAVHSVDGVDTGNSPDLVRKMLLERMGRDIVIRFGETKKEIDKIVSYRLRLDAMNNYALHDPSHINYGALLYGDLRDDRRRPIEIMDALDKSFSFIGHVVSVTSGVIYQIFSGKKDAGDLGGIVQIGEVTGGAFRQSADFGYDRIFLLFAVLSVNIGLLNLLPLPMLDGGHLVFNAVEAIRGKPVSAKPRAYIMVISLGFVLAYILMINVWDVLEIFSKFLY